MTSSNTNANVSFNISDFPCDVIGVHQLFNEILNSSAIIDLRTKSEFDKLHIENSLNDNKYIKNPNSIIPKLPFNGKICVIGGTVDQHIDIYSKTKHKFKGFKSVVQVTDQKQNSTNYPNSVFKIYNKLKMLNLSQTLISQMHKIEAMKNKNESKSNQNEIKVTVRLDTVFEQFALAYPFLCVSSNSESESESKSESDSKEKQHYPNIIIPRKLYLGSVRDRKNLSNSWTHILNISLIEGLTKTKDQQELHIKIDDTKDVDISKHFADAIQFIDNALSSEAKTNSNNTNENMNCVFVHCEMGISRSTTMILAYLMSKQDLSLFEAYKHVQACRSRILPNKGFMDKLFELEKQLFQGKSTKSETLVIMKDVECSIQ